MLVIQVLGVGTNHDSGLRCFQVGGRFSEPAKPWFVTVTVMTSWGIKGSSSKPPIVHPSHHPHMALLHSCGHHPGATAWKLIFEAWKCSFPSRCLFPNRSLILIFFFRFWLPNVIYNKLQDHRGDTSEATNRCMTVLLTVARNSFSL